MTTLTLNHPKGKVKIIPQPSGLRRIETVRSHDFRAELLQLGLGMRTSHQIWLEAASERRMSVSMSLAVKAVKNLAAATGLGISPNLRMALQKGNGAPHA